MQFRVIVVTDPTNTHKQTNMQDRLQYTVLQLAHSVNSVTCTSALLSHDIITPLLFIHLSIYSIVLK